MSKHRYSVCFFIFSLAVSSVHSSDTLHILEKGETLYALSRKYSVPVALLLERNKISDAGKITAGQKIGKVQFLTEHGGDTLLLAEFPLVANKTLDKGSPLRWKYDNLALKFYRFLDHR